MAGILAAALRRNDIGDIASGDGIQLYGVGIGNVFEEPELAELVDSSGGAYFAATDLATVQSQLRLLVNDLLGQYKVSYITLRREGNYRVQVQVDFADVTGIFETLALDVASFFGLDRRGFIGFDPPSVDRERGQAQVFVRALHVPRNIDHFRFKLDTTKNVAITLVPRVDGGLLEGWELSGPDEEGFYDLSSDEPLEFGNFGFLFMVTVPRLFEDVLEIPVAFDNSIYTPGKRFLYPPVMSFGQPAPD